MAKAIRFHKTGGPEVLQLDDVQVGDPGQGQVRIRHTAIGVNFVDTYQRSGLYPMPLPQVAGNEGAGVVEAVGPGVTDLKAGDRVCYTGLIGSYCESRVVPAERMVKLPQGITEEQAASMLLKGLTVHYLIFSTYAVKRGQRVAVGRSRGRDCKQGPVAEDDVRGHAGLCRLRAPPGTQPLVQ